MFTVYCVQVWKSFSDAPRGRRTTRRVPRAATHHLSVFAPDPPPPVFKLDFEHDVPEELLTQRVLPVVSARAGASRALGPAGWRLGPSGRGGGLDERNSARGRGRRGGRGRGRPPLPRSMSLSAPPEHTAPGAGARRAGASRLLSSLPGGSSAPSAAGAGRYSDAGGAGDHLVGGIATDSPLLAGLAAADVLDSSWSSPVYKDIEMVRIARNILHDLATGSMLLRHATTACLLLWLPLILAVYGRSLNKATGRRQRIRRFSPSPVY